MERRRSDGEVRQGGRAGGRLGRELCCDVCRNPSFRSHVPRCSSVAIAIDRAIAVGITYFSHAFHLCASELSAVASRRGGCAARRFRASISGVGGRTFFDCRTRSPIRPWNVTTTLVPRRVGAGAPCSLSSLVRPRALCECGCGCWSANLLGYVVRGPPACGFWLGSSGFQFVQML